MVSAIGSEMDLVEKGGLVIVVLLSILVYFLINSYSSLKYTVVERTESLNESENRYQQLFDNSTDALFLVDKKGSILDANNVSRVVYGYSKKELLKMTIFDLFATEVQKSTVPYIKDILDYSIQFQSIHLSKTGKEFPVEVSSSLIEGERTNPGVLVAARDITKRKKSEEALIRSEEMFSRVFNTVPDSIVLNSPDEKFINVNDSFVKNTGYGKNDVFGKTSKDIGLWKDPLLRDEYVTKLKEEGLVRNFEAELVTKPGTIIYVLISGDKVTIGEEEFLLTVFRDITDLKNTERALVKTESLLNEVSRIAQIGGWEFDVSTGEGTWTSGVALIHDLDPEVKTNKEFGLSFFSPSSKEKLETAIQNAIEKSEAYDVEAELISDKGVHKWVRSLGRPVFEDGKIVKIMGSLQDITDLKEAEDEIRILNSELEQRVIERTSQLEAANKELEAFTYSVSHDLRAPLRAIDGFSRILTEDYESVFDDEAKRLFSVIRSNTKKMDKLITDLLALSRIGRNEINCVDIDMTAMVKSIFIDLVVHKEENNFVFNVTDLPEICADPTLIRQLWTNLLSNAIKYSMKNDEIKIEVDSYSEDGMNVYYVKDNGVGFDPRYSEKVFGIFQRLHNDSEFEGTGVGLAIVQRIVNRHGGKIWAEGKMNEGATFYFHYR
ncbi:MAG: PAS domain S-box protein [Methanolobus sp.]